MQEYYLLMMPIIKIGLIAKDLIYIKKKLVRRKPHEQHNLRLFYISDREKVVQHL